MNFRACSHCKKAFSNMCGCICMGGRDIKILWPLTWCLDSHQTFPLYYGCCPTNEIKVFFSRNIFNFLPKKNAVFLLWSRSTQNEIPSTFHLLKTGAIIHWRKLSFSPLHFFKISWPLTSILKIGTNYDEVKCNLFRSTITNLKSSLIWKKYSKYIISQLKSWKLT